MRIMCYLWDIDSTKGPYLNIHWMAQPPELCLVHFQQQAGEGPEEGDRLEKSKNLKEKRFNSLG